MAQHRTRVVWGTGPVPARVMLLGQNPGIAEDRSGKPFVGPSGQELEHMLWKLGIRREDVYVTNCAKCRSRDDADLKPEWVDTCATKYLLRELQLVQPDLIVALGAVAAHWLLGDAHPHQMELLHGFLYKSTNPLAEGHDVLPCYHPAAGLHNPSLLAQCQWDMSHIKPALFGELPYGPRVGPQPSTLQYEIVTDPRQLPDLLPPDPLGVVAIDTETTEGNRPWCLTACTTPGITAMIMADRTDLVQHFARYTTAMDLKLVIHNVLFDHGVLAEMGMHLDMSRVIDTMIMAYHLQWIPKGLKPLAYRMAGVRMESYEETVQPAQFDKAVAYLRQVAERTWPDPEPEVVLKPDGTPHVKRPQNIRAKAKRALLDVEKGRCGDPRGRWLGMDGRQVVEQEFGPMPDGWLSDLPLEVAKGYACQDADCTRRIYPVLKRLCEDRRFM